MYVCTVCMYVFLITNIWIMWAIWKVSAVFPWAQADTKNSECFPFNLTKLFQNSLTFVIIRCRLLSLDKSLNWNDSWEILHASSPSIACSLSFSMEIPLHLKEKKTWHNVLLFLTIYPYVSHRLFFWRRGGGAICCSNSGDGRWNSKQAVSHSLLIPSAYGAGSSKLS